MTKKVTSSIDTTKYRTIGPVYWDVPGGAATAGILLATDWIIRGYLRDLFESNPASKPNDYREDAEVVFQEVKLEEDTPRPGFGRYTFLVGYALK